MSIFGTVTFDGTGGFNSGTQASDSLNVPAGALIVACAANGGGTAFSDAVISDNTPNSYTQLAFQSTNGGSDGSVWAYCLAATANAATIVTATYTGGGGSGFQSLAVWVIPVTGSAQFDVEALIAAMSGSGVQSSGTMNTTGSDEIAFCLFFDRNASTPYTAVSPAVLDNGQFAATRAAAEHVTFSSAQSAAVLQANTNGGAAVGSASAISFKAGNVSANVTASDTLSFSEGMGENTTAPRAISDSESFSELLHRLTAIGIHVSDVESFSELLAIAVGTGRSVSDIFSFSDSVSLQDDASVPVFGFSPNYYENQQSAGLMVYISPGIINGVMFNGQVVTVPPNATTTISIDGNGKAYLMRGPRLYPIVTVVTGQVVTSGSTGKNANTSNGILSITDVRPNGAFAF